MLVSKPQFDTNVLKPGKAVQITKTDRGYRTKRAAIITDITPLQLTYAYYEDGDRLVTSRVDVDDVAKGFVDIELLVPAAPPAKQAEPPKLPEGS